MKKPKEITSAGTLKELSFYCINVEDKYIKCINQCNWCQHNKKAECNKCGDRGWLYNKDSSRRKICPCHY